MEVWFIMCSETHLSPFEGHVGNIDGCFGGGASLIQTKDKMTSWVNARNPCREERSHWIRHITYEKYGCFKASSAVIRLAGSYVNIWDIKSNPFSVRYGSRLRRIL